MPKFMVEGLAGPQAAQEVDRIRFHDLIKGRVLLGMVAQDPSQSGPLMQRASLFFALSEDLQLHVAATNEGDLEVRLLPRKSDNPPIRLQILGQNEEHSAVLIEHRLHGLRQLYSIVLLLDTGRQDELASAILKNRNVDLETLLAEDDRIYLEAMVPGTFWLVAKAKAAAKVAPRAALAFLALVFGEGRRLVVNFVDKQEQETGRLKDQRVVELSKELDKVTSRKARAAIEQRLDSVMQSMQPVMISRSEPPLRLTSSRQVRR